MKKIVKFLISIVLIVITGCEDIFSPDLENNRTFDDIYSDAYFAEGILMNAYVRIPTNNFNYTDVATDNAMINDKFSNFRNMATGQWSAIFNPVSQWTNAYTAINYVNLLLKHTDSVKWAINDTIRQMFNDRHKGEAYGLRALFLYFLLQAHAGYVGNELMGVPIINEFIDASNYSTIGRNTFNECVEQIYNDCAEAEKYLPLEYKNINKPNLIPPKYANVGVSKYNTVFGDINRQRISGLIVKAIRAKTALLKASPAFGGSTADWEKAANYSAEIIQIIGGISKLDSDGNVFYRGNLVDAINLSQKRDQAEMLWRGSLFNSFDYELNNFPPSLFGNGRINPSQNLVDAFPMANGYPINHSNSGYDASNPYENRDPRLLNYIIVNNTTYAGKLINTSVNSLTDDGIDKTRTSTRTGYYLRKMLREDVNLDPTSRQGKLHYPVHIRYTEIFLIFAEAANEAWGPDGDGGHGITARDVLAQIRKRAGIRQPDEYLASISSKDAMRSLIRNERRLELCFEGHRFWDLRRWKENLTEPVKGVRINNGSYSFETIENRIYKDFMYYGPIPYEEIVKNNNLLQNNGW